tara:strand:- start:522 stop:785 length:264 start_codon:yes stop_codon:yes gene_type:complete
MIKELKYFFYIVSIILFIFFILKYYFSDENIKASYRTTQLFEKNLLLNDDLKLLDNDTKDTVEYIENKLNKNKKKYRFWELLIDHEK